MSRPKPTFENEVIPISFALKRRIYRAFEHKINELGFENRSEVVSQLIIDFLNTHK